MKMQYHEHQKIQFCIQLYIDIFQIVLYLQANPNRIDNLIFISTIVK